MHLVTGDLFDELGKVDLLLVTTNSYITKDHRLVMGRGAAKDLKQHVPDIDKYFGQEIMKTCLGYLPTYGILFYKKVYNTLIGAFQVKHHFKDKADVGLISLSTNILRLLSFYFGIIALNYPGIGNGKLTEKQVYPIIKRLPDNVYVYKRS